MIAHGISHGSHGLTICASTSTLPIGTGLGSSAALSVATAAALIRYRLKKEGMASAAEGDHVVIKDTDTSSSSSSVKRPSRSLLDLINGWAFAAETLLHGHPSGLDNTVSCYGAAVQFRRHTCPSSSSPHSTSNEDNNNNHSNGPPDFRPLSAFPELRVLLTNTGVPRETKALVQKVRQLMTDLPGPTAATMEAMEQVSASFLHVLAGGQKETDKVEEETRRKQPSVLVKLVAMAHGLLNSLGVGHPQLDVIVQEAAGHGFGGSKLTGAGGGGCALTLLLSSSPGEEEKRRKELQCVLEEKYGFKCYVTVLGGEGVLWHEDS